MGPALVVRAKKKVVRRVEYGEVVVDMCMVFGTHDSTSMAVIMI